MFKSNKISFKKIAAGALLISFFVIPVSTEAATATSYQPQTREEMIAYLYGRISQLVEMQQRYGQSGSNSVSNSAIFNYATADTHRADSITNVSAVLRGEVFLFGDATAYAWFEYGKDSSFLDQRTSKSYIGSAYERAVRIDVRNLEEDERYYFRIVAEDRNKNLRYGEVYGFRTDEDNN